MEVQADVSRDLREKLRLQEAALQQAHIVIRDLEDRILFWSEADAEIYGGRPTRLSAALSANCSASSCPSDAKSWNIAPAPRVAGKAKSSTIAAMAARSRSRRPGRPIIAKTAPSAHS